MLRTYFLLDFVKKFFKKIELALSKIGLPFIIKYCFEKYGSIDQRKNSTRLENQMVDKDKIV